ncbi:MAG TPA: 2-dehydropantoate 2-reductase [Verrucomicrobiales bacterium]|nr:2-dehydropantoate 2-reductase [Verrucomicrobiales bacterium]
MKSFAIVGAGAVGSYYGARLAAAGNEVRFFLRSDFDEVSRNGIKVKSIHGDFNLPEVDCFRSPEEVGKVDVVIVAWKATANDYFEAVIGPMLHEDTTILTLQNGMGNVERLSELFGLERVLGGMCFVCINRMKAGVIHHVGGGLIVMGEVQPASTSRLEVLVDIFEAAKIACQGAPVLELVQWRKLVWNISFNGLCITEGGITTRDLLAQDGGEERVRAIMAEVVSIAGALGYEIPAEFIDDQIEITGPMGSYRPSSMIDFMEGREVELESIWGEPLRRAKAAGVETPLTDTLYEELLRTVSKTH